MTTVQNPALHQESRDQPAKIPPQVHRETLLNWLNRTGRLKSDTPDDVQVTKPTEDLDEILDPEIYASDKEEE
jgi:hypothetical protein